MRRPRTSPQKRGLPLLRRLPNQYPCKTLRLQPSPLPVLLLSGYSHLALSFLLALSHLRPSHLAVSAGPLTPVALSPFPLGSLPLSPLPVSPFPLSPCALRTVPPVAIKSAATAASGSDRDTVTVDVKIIRHEPPALNGIVVRVGVTGTIWSRQYKAGVLDGSELFEYPDGRKDYFRWSNGKQIAFAKFDSSNSEHAAFLKASADANHQMEVY